MSMVLDIHRYFSRREGAAPLETLREGAAFTLAIAMAYRYPEWAQAFALQILDSATASILLEVAGPELMEACPAEALQ